jgi:hypothetical protein
MSYVRRFVVLQEPCVPTHLLKIYRFVSLDWGNSKWCAGLNGIRDNFFTIISAN